MVFLASGPRSLNNADAVNLLAAYRVLAHCRQNGAVAPSPPLPLPPSAGLPVVLPRLQKWQEDQWLAATTAASAAQCKMKGGGEKDEKMEKALSDAFAICRALSSPAGFDPSAPSGSSVSTTSGYSALSDSGSCGSGGGGEGGWLLDAEREEGGMSYQGGERLIPATFPLSRLSRRDLPPGSFQVPCSSPFLSRSGAWVRPMEVPSRPLKQFESRGAKRGAPFAWEEGKGEDDLFGCGNTDFASLV